MIASRIQRSALGQEQTTAVRISSDDGSISCRARRRHADGAGGRLQIEQLSQEQACRSGE